FVGTAHIGLAHDFDERGAAAVQIDVRVAVGIFKAVVNAFAGVVFHVHASDADAPLCSVDGDIDVATFGHWLIVLRNLVALGQVGVKVVLAGEPGKGAHLAVQRKRAANGQFDGHTVQDRQRARQSEANRADVGIGRRAETGGASAKDFGSGSQLHVHFEPDDG